MRTISAPPYSYNRTVRAFIRALIVLHRAFRSRDLRTRVHVLLRFLTCPFLRVLRFVPPNARLLDIGAGHGAFSVLAADRGARVVAVEPDLRKVLPVHGVQFVIGFDEVVRGQFDAIAINDVLYKLPVAQWDALLTRAKDRLTAGGVLIIKEHDPTARWKNAWNRAQESIATRLHLTLGESFSYETPADFTARLRRLGFRDVEARRIDFGYPHAHIVYVARR
jgi:2-polyprenyl-3-methyl-5-hydroxy-6-metoxy-1,4-benzoquinol methylase